MNQERYKKIISNLDNEEIDENLRWEIENLARRVSDIEFKNCTLILDYDNELHFWLKGRKDAFLMEIATAIGADVIDGQLPTTKVRGLVK